MSFLCSTHCIPTDVARRAQDRLMTQKYRQEPETKKNTSHPETNAENLAPTFPHSLFESPLTWPG